MALVTSHRAGDRVLVVSHHLAQVFRIQAPGKLGGTHQITEHDRDLAALGLGPRAPQAFGFAVGFFRFRRFRLKRYAAAATEFSPGGLENAHSGQTMANGAPHSAQKR